MMSWAGFLVVAGPLAGPLGCPDSYDAPCGAPVARIPWLPGPVRRVIMAAEIPVPPRATPAHAVRSADAAAGFLVHDPAAARGHVRHGRLHALAGHRVRDGGAGGRRHRGW